MRVLIVSGIFHPDVGGPATYLHDLAHALTREGHQIAVLTYGDADRAGRYPFPVWRVSRRGSPAARLWRFTRALLRVSPDYRLWFVNDYGVPALLAAAVRRPRIVMKIVGDFAWEYARRNHLITEGIDDFQHGRYGPRIELLRTLQRRYVRAASRVIVPSEYLAALVRGWGAEPARISVVRNAVSWEAQGAPGGPTSREPATMFTASRLAPWKGVDHLLRTFAVLHARMPEARLVIAGDGPERARLHALAGELGIAGGVTWLGDVDRTRVREWMHRASVFVLLSEYEGLSHVLLEAMAEGLPVVASAAGGNVELITDAREGLIVDPADYTGTAARVERLLTTPALANALAAAARQRVQEQTWDGLVAATRLVLESAAAGAG